MIGFGEGAEEEGQESEEEYGKNNSVNLGAIIRIWYQYEHLQKEVEHGGVGCAIAGGVVVHFGAEAEQHEDVEGKAGIQEFEEEVDGWVFVPRRLVGRGYRGMRVMRM